MIFVITSPSGKGSRDGFSHLATYDVSMVNKEKPVKDWFICWP